MDEDEMTNNPGDLYKNREALLEAMEANDWDFERVANSMSFMSPRQVLKLESDIERCQAAGNKFLDSIEFFAGKIASMRQAIKRVEWSGVDGRDGDACCPWCRSWEICERKHDDKCDAFEPDGTVK